MEERTREERYMSISLSDRWNKRVVDGNGNGNGNGSLPSSKDDKSSIVLRKRRCIRCMFDFVRLLALPLGVLVSD